MWICVGCRKDEFAHSSNVLSAIHGSEFEAAHG